MDTQTPLSDVSDDSPSGNESDNIEMVESVGSQGVLEELEATWYGLEDGYGLDSDKLYTASGERYDPGGYTAASNMYPLGARLAIWYGDRDVVVVITDRCGACELDLSRAAFERLAPLSRGRIMVNVEVLR